MKFWENKPGVWWTLGSSLRKYWDVYSVTSIISVLGWLEFVDKEVLAKACANWTALHNDIEETYKHWRFILGSSLNRRGWMKFYTAIWSKWKPLHLEIKMVTSLAWWTADAVMNINWETVMVDWKTTASSVPKEMLWKYKMQIAQYSSMYEKLHWNIDRAVIVAFNRNWWYTLINLDKKELIKYKNKFNETYKLFKKQLWNY